MFLAYASPKGRALIDRELYLPRSWTGDQERLAAAPRLLVDADVIQPCNRWIIRRRREPQNPDVLHRFGVLAGEEDVVRRLEPVRKRRRVRIGSVCLRQLA